MIVSLLLVGLYFIGLVAGDDPSSSTVDDATITPMTTVMPTYTVLAPTDSPTLDLFGSVTFIWSAEGYNVAGYFCQPVSTRSYMESYTSWMNSKAAVTTSGLTTYEAEYIGSIMFLSNYGEFPATCCFGMATDTRDGPDSTGGGDLIVQLTSFPGGETVSMPMTTTDTQTTSLISPVQKTAFYTAPSTIPSESTVQPATTALQPPPIETIPGPVPEPENDHDLSGGAKAGIVIGSVSGALILVGLVTWRKTGRRRSSTSEALLSGFEEMVAPIKESFRRKTPAGELNTWRLETGDGVVHEMNVPDRTVRVFEMESPQQRYTDGLHELPER